MNIVIVTTVVNTTIIVTGLIFVTILLGSIPQVP